MFALQPELKIFSGSAKFATWPSAFAKYVGVPLGRADDQLVSRRRDLRKDRGKHPWPRRFHHSADLVRLLINI